jgi:hypothetical protein
MGESEADRSPELDQVRRMLFPQLPPDEGWARIDAAISGAADSQRMAAIERLASGDLSDDLLSLLRLLREK